MIKIRNHFRCLLFGIRNISNPSVTFALNIIFLYVLAPFANKQHTVIHYRVVLQMPFGNIAHSYSSCVWNCAWNSSNYCRSIHTHCTYYFDNHRISAKKSHFPRTLECLQHTLTYKFRITRQSILFFFSYSSVLTIELCRMNRNHPCQWPDNRVPLETWFIIHIQCNLLSTMSCSGIALPGAALPEMRQWELLLPKNHCGHTVVGVVILRHREAATTSCPQVWSALLWIKVQKPRIENEYKRNKIRRTRVS